MNIEFGLLPIEKYDLLKPIFEAEGGEVPDPSFSRIAIAMDGDNNNEIIGFYCLQLVQHGEPLWIHPDYRKSGAKIIPRLIQIINEIRGKGKIYIVAENEESDRICKSLGLKRIYWPVYVKED